MTRTDAVAWFLIGAVTAAGCAAQVRERPAPPLSAPEVIIWSHDLPEYGLRLWAAKVQAKVGRHVHLVAVHGVWVILPDAGWPLPATQVMRAMRAKTDPADLVVLFACNELHHSLGVRGVLYSPDVIWVCPGPDVRYFDGVSSRAVGSVGGLTCDQ